MYTAASSLRRVALASAIALGCGLAPAPAAAIGPNAIRTPAPLVVPAVVPLSVAPPKPVGTTTRAGTAQTASPGSSQRYEETDPAVAYWAYWIQDTTESWSAGAAQISAMAGARATFAFTGTSASWIGARAPNTGIARVYVDGVFMVVVDTYSPSEEIRVSMFTANDLPDTTHTLTIEVTGAMNAAATEAWVCVDAFDVPAVSVSRLQETDPAVAFSDGWIQGDTSRQWTEGRAALSASPGAQVTFTFTGTAVSWLGGLGPQTGIASVYLDGAFVADVDTYAAAEQIQASVFAIGSLANATHTLAIVVSGQQNAASSSPLIVVDGFEVTVPGRRYQNTDPSITYSPEINWNVYTNDHAYAEGSTAETLYGGSIATFAFVGSGVSLVGATCGRCGIASISIDGGAPVEIDLYSPGDAPQKTVFTVADLPFGAHTIAVEATGRKNPFSVYFWVLVDAFDVVP